MPGLYQSGCDELRTVNFSSPAPQRYAAVDRRESQDTSWYSSDGRLPTAGNVAGRVVSTGPRPSFDNVPQRADGFSTPTGTAVESTGQTSRGPQKKRDVCIVLKLLFSIILSAFVHEHHNVSSLSLIPNPFQEVPDASWVRVELSSRPDVASGLLMS